VPNDATESEPESESDRRSKTAFHITIDEYQREYLDTKAGSEVNVSELSRAALDAVIPPSAQPDDPPDRGFDVDVDLDGPLSHLAQNGSQPPERDE